MRRNYLNEYGGPLVDWPADCEEPDWAALYPVPDSQRIEDRPAKRRRRAQQTADEPDGSDSEDDEEGEEDDFWLSPRMACRLHFAGCLFVDNWREDLGDTFEIETMPPVVQPYVRHKQWAEAYVHAGMRLVRRLEKGSEPRPNCTAEEFVLHRIISMARDFRQDGVDEAVADVIEALPRSTLDEDFDLVSEVAFQDHDVLMLFDMPRLIHPSGLSHNMGLANLHPDDWFKPFDTGLTSNHV